MALEIVYRVPINDTQYVELAKDPDGFGMLDITRRTVGSDVFEVISIPNSSLSDFVEAINLFYEDNS